MLKKLLLPIVIVFCYQLNFGQHFNQFFTNKTLRINYTHIADAKSDSIVIHSFHAGNTWTGTLSFLIDPMQYGHLLLQAYDSVSNQLIFSKSYSSLCEEYKATEQAVNAKMAFEEVLIMPFPLKTIKFTITYFTRNLLKKELYSSYFNPQSKHVIPFSSKYKTVDLHVKGRPQGCLDILLIPDGYTKFDKKKLASDMQRFSDYISKCDPYSENAGQLNIRYLECYSDESGVSDPKLGVTKKTVLNSSFNTINLDRYLMTLNVWKMYELAENSPFDIILVVCNTAKYGGGGIFNFYCTVSSDNPSSDFVVVHELGHTIAGLADEYFTSDVSVQDYYPENIEPLEPNITTLIDFKSKWATFVSSKTPIPTPDNDTYNKKVGVFEGGGYVAKGVYRPYRNCTMKDVIYNNFCPVCKTALTEAFDYYSNYDKTKNSVKYKR